MAPSSSPRIAAETKIVYDPYLQIDRKVIAGQPIPPGLEDSYDGKVQNPSTTGGTDEGSTDYASQTKDDLQAEADRRGLTVDGSGATGNVTKDDLIKALTSADGGQ